MECNIRPYHPSDLPSVYRICVQTVDSGADGSHHYAEPELVGHYFAGPYAVRARPVFEPQLRARRAGVAAICESEKIGRRCEAEWFPILRERYPLPAPEHLPSAGMIRTIHAGYHSHPDVAAYPAHLHIDLLPHAVGQGNGRRMMERFLCHLRELRVPAVHLGVGKDKRARSRVLSAHGLSHRRRTRVGVLHGVGFGQVKAGQAIQITQYGCAAS